MEKCKDCGGNGIGMMYDTVHTKCSRCGGSGNEPQGCVDNFALGLVQIVFFIIFLALVLAFLTSK